MKCVFYINRFFKTVIGLFVFSIILISLFGLWGFFYNERQTAIDRSNAMQVTKMENPIENNSENSSEIYDKNLSGLTPLAATPDFFTEYRLERDKIRSERTDVLRDILKNASTDEARSQVQNEILQMTLEKRLESEMENLIKSKGFGDALVFIRANSVNAVVKSSSLSKEEVMQVADIITKVCGTKAEDITVSAKP